MFSFDFGFNFNSDFIGTLDYPSKLRLEEYVHTLNTRHKFDTNTKTELYNKLKQMFKGDDLLLLAKYDSEILSILLENNSKFNFFYNLLDVGPRELVQEVLSHLVIDLISCNKSKLINKLNKSLNREHITIDENKTIQNEEYELKGYPFKWILNKYPIHTLTLNL